jgi:hypothetical protein
MASHSAFKVPITREAYGSFFVTIRTGEMPERLATHFSSKCPFAFCLLTDTEPALPRADFEWNRAEYLGDEGTDNERKESENQRHYYIGREMHQPRSLLDRSS